MNNQVFKCISHSLVHPQKCLHRRSLEMGGGGGGGGGTDLEEFVKARIGGGECRGSLSFPDGLLSVKQDKLCVWGCGATLDKVQSCRR